MCIIHQCMITCQPLIQVFHDYFYWVKSGIRDCTDYEWPVTYMVVTRHHGYLIPVWRAIWYTVIVWRMSGHYSGEASPCILLSVIYAGAPYRLLTSNILQTVLLYLYDMYCLAIQITSCIVLRRFYKANSIFVASIFIM